MMRKARRRLFCPNLWRAFQFLFGPLPLQNEKRSQAAPVEIIQQATRPPFVHLILF
jgi:hypothetical protein